MPTQDVTAVVVNWNAGELLVDCVRHLRRAGVERIVVVDNDSTDGSADTVESVDAGVSLIRSGANLGFGAGMNLGARSAGTDLLLACNPDLLVEDGAVDALVAHLETRPGVGLVGPLVLNGDGSAYPSARRFPSFVDAIGHALLSLVWATNPFTRRYRQLDMDRSEAGTADWVSGSCLLIRRETWDALGGFDENFFMYMEDVDLCRRAWSLGWQVGFEPLARVVHFQGRSADQRPYRMIFAHHRSMARYSIRAADGKGRLALPFLLAGIALRAVAASAHRALTGRTDRSGRSIAPPKDR